jgi:hypothetical protein
MVYIILQPLALVWPVQDAQTHESDASRCMVVISYVQVVIGNAIVLLSNLFYDV